jgi:HAD superfamily hydrolase (TIGR01509 family)
MTQYTDQQLTDLILKFLERRGYKHVDVRAALCDMDGTLYDSMPWHARAWHAVCDEYGIRSDVDEFFMYEGMTGAATINVLFRREFNREATPDEIKEFYHRKTVKFCEFQPVSVMPGAKSVVREFISRDITPVLVTGSGQSSLIKRLGEDYDNAFNPDIYVTAADVRHGKPDPEPYLMALNHAGVSADRAIALENAPLGVRSAADAGVFTVAVATGPIPLEALGAEGAAIVFSSMEECAATMPRLLTLLQQTAI